MRQCIPNVYGVGFSRFVYVLADVFAFEQISVVLDDARMPLIESIALAQCLCRTKTARTESMNQAMIEARLERMYAEVMQELRPAASSERVKLWLTDVGESILGALDASVSMDDALPLDGVESL